MAERTSKEKALSILRWIVMLPAAAGGSLLAYYIVDILNRLGMARYGDPDSFMGKVFTQWASNLALGAAFVFIATYIAPSFKKQVAIFMAGLALLLSGATLFAAILTRDYWAMFATVCLNVGSIGVAYTIFTKQVAQIQ